MKHYRVFALLIALCLALGTLGGLAEVDGPDLMPRGGEAEAAAIELEVGEAPEFELVDDASAEAQAEPGARVSAAEAGLVPKSVEGDIAIDAAHFPDSGFRALLSSKADLSYDGVLSPEDRNRFTSISANGIFNGDHIEDLTGIAYFPNLDSITCLTTGLKSIVISQNPKLTSLNLTGNPLNGTVKLKNNQLTGLTVNAVDDLENRIDLSSLTKLKYLECMKSGLTKLDTSAMPDLETLKCRENHLTSLDLRNNKNLKDLECEYNHELSRLYISDNAPLEKLYCSGTSLKSLKLKGCTVLLNLECVENPKLQSLDITGCSSLLQAVKEPDNHEAGEESAIFTKSNIDQVINRKARLHFPVSCTLTANGAVLYAQSKSVAGCTITAGSVVYTGKALKPIPKVKYNGTALKKGVDFKVVSYKNNKKVGYGTVTIKGMGAYEGEAQGTFKILPKATRIKRVTGGKGKLTAKWTKVAGVAGYQIQISLKKDFSSGLKKMLSGASTTGKTLDGLKTKGTYYVRVRAYHKIGKEYFWSAWSATKKVSVK